MSMYNLIEYSDNYSATFGSLWHYYRDEPFLNVDGDITDFLADDNNIASFKFKRKIVCKIEEHDNTKNVKPKVPLKYLSNFWRILEISLIDCEINLILTWSNKRLIIDSPIASQEPTFAITDTKFYFPVFTLSTQENAKLLEQLKPGFKRTINRNKYEPKVTVEQQSHYLDFLIDSSFQGVNTLFVLSFQTIDGRTGYTRYYLPLVQRKDYNVVIDGQNFFDQPVKNNLITYGII